MTLSVREIQEDDIPLITNYWMSADNIFLEGMGVDVSKMPTKEFWQEMLEKQLSQSYNEKQSYATIWLADDGPIGHCNINKIVFGEEAYMHLHLWHTDIRQKGIGAELVKLSLPYFFENCALKMLYCEPYALNLAPNKTLEKLGFTFEKEYTTTPGFLNFEQPVIRWHLSYDRYKTIV